MSVYNSDPRVAFNLDGSATLLAGQFAQFVERGSGGWVVRQQVVTSTVLRTALFDDRDAAIHAVLGPPLVFEAVQ